jgi:cytochrome c2
MDFKKIGMGLFAALVAASGWAEDGDVVGGEKLYVSQCKICHGSASSEASASNPPAWRLAFAGTDQSARQTATDIPLTGRLSLVRESTHVIAFAPPFGPNLRGVYGRPAGSVQGFDYSAAFVKALKGMEWNEASLDVWISSPQAWVPGVYMFYKQPDPEIRRKIIVYLKANH